MMVDASIRCSHTQAALQYRFSQPTHTASSSHAPSHTLLLHSTTQAQAGRPPDRDRSPLSFLVPVSPPAIVMIMGPHRCRTALLLASLLWAAALLHPVSGFNGPSLFLPRPPLRQLVGRTAGTIPAAGAATGMAGISSRLGSLQRRRQHKWMGGGMRLAAEAAEAGAVDGAQEEDKGAGGEHKEKAPSFLKVLWRFTRPHTFIGTALCIPSLTLFAAPPTAQVFTWRVVFAILWALVPAGLINVYITGLNQVTDVEIDRINKPYLPIAAGQLSRAAASLVVVASLIAGLGIGLLPSPYGSPALLWVLLSSALLGTAYSLPPLRLKRFPALAALCIIAVRGAAINMGFYGHALTAAFGPSSPSSFSPTTLSVSSFAQALAPLLRDGKCMAATLFFAVFGAVIALMKDVPDIKGDRLNNIRSFSVRAGAARIFKLGTRLTASLFLGSGALCLAAAYHAFSTTTSSLSSLPVLARALMALLALGSAREVWRRAQAVNPQDGEQVYGFYMFLWRLFYLSYVALPLAR